MKKGMGQNTLISIILVGVVALILFAFATKLVANSKSGTRGQFCLTTMNVKLATTIDAGIKTYRGIDEFCPKYRVFIGEDKTEIMRGTDSFEKRKYDELTEDVVRDVVAKEMLHCWRQFGSGKQPFFHVPTNWLQDIIKKKDLIGCRVCSDITFKDVEAREFDGVKEYLDDASPSGLLVSEDDMRYYELLAEHTAGCSDEYLSEDESNCWEDFAEEYDIDTDPVLDSKTIYEDSGLSKSYLVVFVRKDMRKGRGTMNTYLMDVDTKNRVCEESLPYR